MGEAGKAGSEMNKDNFVFKLDINDIGSGAADHTAGFMFDLWKDTNGFLDDRLLHAASHYGIFIVTPDNPLQPEIHYLGDDALAVRLLGTSWSSAPKQTFNAMSDEYRELVGAAYRSAALHCKPSFDLVSSEVGATSETRALLRYQRLILPFNTIYGATFLFIYSQDAGSCPPARGLTQAGECPLVLPQQNTNLVSSLGLVGLPK